MSTPQQTRPDSVVSTADHAAGIWFTIGKAKVPALATVVSGRLTVIHLISSTSTEAMGSGACAGNVTVAFSPTCDTFSGVPLSASR